MFICLFLLFIPKLDFFSPQLKRRKCFLCPWWPSIPYSEQLSLSIKMRFAPELKELRALCCWQIEYSLFDKSFRFVGGLVAGVWILVLFLKWQKPTWCLAPHLFLGIIWKEKWWSFAEEDCPPSPSLLHMQNCQNCRHYKEKSENWVFPYRWYFDFISVNYDFNLNINLGYTFDSLLWSCLFPVSVKTLISET